MFDECTNPLCTNPIEFASGITWRRTPKKFCCDECKTNVWALRKAADLLSSVTAKKKLEILESVLSPNNGAAINDNQHGITMDNQCEFNGNSQHGSNIDNPQELKGNVIRRYACDRWPQLGIGGKVRFFEGRFETDDPKIMALIEHNEAFGAQILRVEGIFGVLG
jgi:hypothetical protein